MKKKDEKNLTNEPGPKEEPNEELELIIRKKNIQNKILKELIDQIKSNK